MKYIALLSFITLLLTTGISQTNTLLPLPQTELTVLQKSISGVEITPYNGSQTLSMQGLNNSRFIPAAIDTLAPDSLNAKNDAYIMIMVNDDFYMDAELSFNSGNPYMIFKKDGQKYYSRLTSQGTYFFEQLLK